jgi:hypothetical protein
MTSYIPFQLLRSGFNTNTKLLVSDSKKLPKDISYLKGQTVKFVKFLGNQVSINYKGGKVYVPIDTVLAYQDRTVLTSPTKDDTCFVVHSRNKFFDIGAVFEGTVFTSGKALILTTTDEKRIEITDDWAYAINPLAKPSKLDDLTTKFKVKPEQKVEIPLTVAVTEDVKVDPIVEPVIEVQSKKPANAYKNVFDYTSTDLDPFEMFKDKVDEHLSETGDYFDISGKSHSTLLACLKQNQYYIDLAYANAVVDISNDLIKGKK